MVLTSTFLTRVRGEVKTACLSLFTYGAVGTANTTPDESDTALGSEVFRDTVDEFDMTVTDQFTASLQVLTTEANGNTIREVGFFDAASAGNLWTRHTLNSIAKTSDIQLYLDVEVTISVTEGAVTAVGEETTSTWDEDFNTADYAATGNTADWDTTNSRLAMSSSSDHGTMYNTQGTTTAIASGTIVSATLTADETKWDAGDQILYYLSKDGGTSWEQVENGVLTTFTPTGTSLKVRVIFIGSGGSSTYIENLSVEVTTSS